MQSISSRIWTRVVVSISNDDNHYTTSAEELWYNVIVCLWVTIYISWQRSTIEVTQGLFEKSVGACHIDFYGWYTIVENHDAWRFTSNYVLSSIENIRRVTLKDKEVEKKER